MSTNKTETARERLTRLRAQVAELDRVAAEAEIPVVPGDTVHALESGLTISTGAGWLTGGAVLARGQNLVITAALLEANRDAGGRFTGPALARNPAEQVRVHGRVIFGFGEAPSDMLPERGTAEFREARENARREAWAMPTAEGRHAALKDVHERFGDAETTSVYWRVEDPSVRQAEEQQAALAAGGVRLVNNYEAREPGQAGERR